MWSGQDNALRKINELETLPNRVQVGIPARCQGSSTPEIQIED